MNKLAYNSLNVIEDGLRWLSPQCKPYWAFSWIWSSRGFLTETRTRQLLRRAIKNWAKDGIYSQDLFSERELKREFTDRCVVVTIEWKPYRLMTGTAEGD